MPVLFYLVGVLTIIASVLTIVTAPTAIQEIGGACLWGFGWLIVGCGVVMQRLGRIADKAVQA